MIPQSHFRSEGTAGSLGKPPGVFVEELRNKSSAQSTKLLWTNLPNIHLALFAFLSLVTPWDVQGPFWSKIIITITYVKQKRKSWDVSWINYQDATRNMCLVHSDCFKSPQILPMFHAYATDCHHFEGQNTGPKTHQKIHQQNLVGGWPTPLKSRKVNWDDDIPNIQKKKSHVPVTTINHHYTIDHYYHPLFINH